MAQGGQGGQGGVAPAGRLSGRVAWVTGGGSGIGAATAAALAEEGALVAVSGRRAEELERVAQALRARGLRAHAHPLDVADANAVARVAAAIEAAHGPVAQLVCSAGTNVPDRFWKGLDTAAFDRVVAINLSGVAHCVHAVLPGMRERGGGTACERRW